MNLRNNNIRKIKRNFNKILSLYASYSLKFASFIILLELYLIFFFYNQNIFFPIFTNISSLNSILTNLSTVFPTILGIVAAILLVAFQSVKNIFSSFAYQTVFKPWVITNCSILFAFTLFTPLSTLFLVSDTIQANIVNLTIFSSTLFLISVFIIAAIAYYSIKFTQPRYTLKKVFKKLDEVTKPPITLAVNQDDEAYFSTIEDDPVFVLSEAVIRSCENKDRITPIEIIHYITNKLQKVINDPDNFQNKKIIAAFSPVFTNCIKHSVKYDLDLVVEDIIYKFRKLYKTFAIRNIDRYDLNPLDQFLGLLINELVENEKRDLISIFITQQINFFEFQLQYNAPSEKDLWTIKHWLEEADPKEADPDKDAQWYAIVNKGTALWTTMLNHSTTKKDAYNLSELLGSIIFFTSSCTKFNLGPYQIRDILKKSYFVISSIFDQAIKNKFVEDLFFGPIVSTVGNSLLDKNEVYSKIPLIYSSRVYIELAKNGYYQKHNFNDFLTIGRTSIRKIDQEIHYSTVQFISDSINKMRMIFENQANDSNISAYYSDLKAQHNSLLEFLDNFEGSEKNKLSIKEKLISVQKSFNEKIYDNSIKSYVPWPEPRND